MNETTLEVPRLACSSAPAQHLAESATNLRLRRGGSLIRRSSHRTSVESDEWAEGPPACTERDVSFRLAVGIWVATVAFAQEPTPVFTAAGVVSAASFAPGLTPGGLATLFGTGLTFGVNGVLRAPGFPMPANIQGTMVYVNGVAAPLKSVADVDGKEQINFQVPMELAGTSAAVLQARNGQQLSQPVVVPVVPFQPAVFTSDGQRGVVVHGVGGALVTPENPAAAGEIVVIYATGLGPVNPTLGTGVAASPGHLTYTANSVMVSFGNQAGTPIFAGLTPGFAGLYQINVQVPARTPAGNVAVVVTVGEVSSPPVLIAIK
jgi:uncharacterized protein (TIGR03437 family)